MKYLKHYENFETESGFHETELSKWLKSNGYSEEDYYENGHIYMRDYIQYKKQ